MKQIEKVKEPTTQKSLDEIGPKLNEIIDAVNGLIRDSEKK